MQLEEVIRVFRANANAEHAVAMAQYMKNNFPFLGIPKPLRVALQKAFLASAKKDEIHSMGLDFYTLGIARARGSLPCFSLFART